MRYLIGIGTVLAFCFGLWNGLSDSESDTLEPRVTLAEVASQIEQTIDVTQTYVGQQRDAACREIKPHLEAMGDQLHELAPPAHAAWNDLQSGFASAWHELDLAFRNALRRFRE